MSRIAVAIFVAVVTLSTSFASYAAVDSNEILWVEDGVPLGASSTGLWNWTTPKASGTKSHNQIGVAGAIAQHYFENASPTFAVNAGDVLTTYMYAASAPETIMLQWRAVDDAWLHRAYWGVNHCQTSWPAIYGTPSCWFMGPIPSSTSTNWAKLEVPAATVNLVGKQVSGMAFTLYGAGNVYFDRSGKRPPLAQPAMTAPTNGQSFPNTTASVKLDWGTVAGAAHYAVRLNDNTQPTIARDARNTCSTYYLCVDNLATSPSYVNVAVVPGHSYTWWIYAVDGYGTFSNSTQVTFSIQPPPGPPAQPTIVIPNAGANYSMATTQANLTWQAVSGATSYSVRVYDDTNTVIRLPNNNCAGSYLCRNAVGTTVLYVPLTPGHSYRWYVQAVNAFGASTYALRPFTISPWRAASGAVFFPDNSFLGAWIGYYNTRSDVRSQVNQELDDLRLATNLSYVNVTVTSTTLTWPDINTDVLASVAQFVDYAASVNVQVGITLTSHCSADQNVPITAGHPHIVNAHSDAYDECKLTPAERYAQDQTYFRQTVEGIESRTVNQGNIMYFEMTGSYLFDASETPVFSTAQWETAEGIAQVREWVRNVWPYFKASGTRPKLFNFLVDEYKGVDSIVTFKSLVTPADYPDFWSPTMSLPTTIASNSHGLPFQAIYDQISPKSKIIFNDLGWGHNGAHPTGRTQAQTFEYAADEVRAQGLAGFWIWQYRDGSLDPLDLHCTNAGCTDGHCGDESGIRACGPNGQFRPGICVFTNTCP